MVDTGEDDIVKKPSEDDDMVITRSNYSANRSKGMLKILRVLEKVDKFEKNLLKRGRMVGDSSASTSRPSATNTKETLEEPSSTGPPIVDSLHRSYADTFEATLRLLSTLHEFDAAHDNDQAPKVPPWFEEINEYDSTIPPKENPHHDAETIASTKPQSATSNNMKRNSNVYILGFDSMLFVLVASHIWKERESILANQLPVSVVSILVGAAFYLGYKLDKRLSVIGEIGEHKNIDQSKSQIKDKSIYKEKNYKSVHLERPLTVSRDDTSRRSILAYAPKNEYEARAWEEALSAPLSHRSQLMQHLLKSSPDYSRRQISMRRLQKKIRSMKFSTLRGSVDRQTNDAGIREPYFPFDNYFDEGIQEEEDHDSEYSDDRETYMIEYKPIGNLELNDTRATVLEENDLILPSFIVDPLCKLRGMDLFLSDDPPGEIWKQPMLKDGGLRDMPTFIANLMLPFGNITAYFALPDWVDSLSNIPEEEVDDPADVKALKRFLMGNNEYRNARLKVIPCLVDGPLAIRLIKPEPMEVCVHNDKHPAIWTDVDMSIDSFTNKTSQMVVEVDIDFISNRSYRKLFSLVRPHMPSLTIDVAFVASKPKNSTIEEPSVCLGIWRIDKVDFERCAVFPESTIEETAHALSMFFVDR